MRFKAKSNQKKVLWLTNEVVEEGRPLISYANCLEYGKPWAELSPEEIQSNLDVGGYIQKRGE